MPGPEFFQTVRGTRFYDHDVPRIAKGLERIAAALEEIAKRLPPEKQAEGEETDGSS